MAIATYCFGSQAVHQRTGRRLHENSSDSANSEGEPDALFVPLVSSQVDRDEWPDSGLNVGEKKIKRVQTPQRSDGRRVPIARIW